jgi:hypothetical protein
MKLLTHRSVRRIGLAILICATASVRTMGGGIMVSDASKLPDKDGCLLAFTYNQKDDDRLVVIDEKNHRYYEAPLKRPKQAPFWEGGKLYVVGHDGSLQGFTIGLDKLVAEKEETITTNVLWTAEYSRSQHRLYLICTYWDKQRTAFHELSAIDFPTRKTLWTTKIDDPGSLTIMESYVCIKGLKLVQAFNCDTGVKLGEIEGARESFTNSNEHK